MDFAWRSTSWWQAGRQVGVQEAAGLQVEFIQPRQLLYAQRGWEHEHISKEGKEAWPGPGCPSCPPLVPRSQDGSHGCLCPKKKDKGEGGCKIYRADSKQGLFQKPQRATCLVPRPEPGLRESGKCLSPFVTWAGLGMRPHCRPLRIQRARWGQEQGWGRGKKCQAQVKGPGRLPCSTVLVRA